MSTVKKAQTFPILKTLKIGFVPRAGDDVSLPTEHELKAGDWCVCCFLMSPLAYGPLTFQFRFSIYVLKRGQSEPPLDMRKCDVFIVSEIRKDKKQGAKPVVIAHPALRFSDDKLTADVLGFPQTILGDGELVITNGLSVVDPARIVCKLLSFSMTSRH